MLNSGIRFRLPTVPKKNQLDAEFTNHAVSLKLENRDIPSFPPINLLQIIKYIKNGLADVITLLEWSNAFQEDIRWTEERRNEEVEAATILWGEILKNNTVKSIVFFKASLYLDNQIEAFPKFILSRLNDVRQFVKPADLPKLDWIQFIQNKEFQNCAQAIYLSRLTPLQYLSKIRLAKAINYRSEIYKACISQLSFDHSDAESKWLCNVLDEAITRDRVAMVDDVLERSENISDGDFAGWLSSNCLPNTDNSLWGLLTPHSRTILSERFNLSCFSVLENLITGLTTEKVSQYLSINDTERNQLVKRSKFWKNYKEQFLQVRILLPKATFELFRPYFDVDDNMFQTLPENESNEVCIFEFEKIIVVEVLRGKISETRIFDNSTRNKSRLMEASPLSLSEIRNMAESFVHDHVILWQHFLEKQLISKFNILPDKIDLAHSVYVKPIDMKSFKMRTEQLDKWEKIFWDNEFRLPKHKNTSVMQKNGILALASAKAEPLSGNRSKYVSLLTTASKNGNAEAMYLLGSHLIKGINKDKSIKLGGEKWLKESAKAGYEPAIDVCRKFNLL